MRGDLTGLAIVGGTGVVTFGSMVAYFTAQNMGAPGWTGPAGLVVVVGAGAGAWGVAKLQAGRAERRAIEAAYNQWIQEVAECPRETDYALSVLCDPWQNLLMWTNPQISIGQAPNPNTGFPGVCPVLLPGQDPGHKPDQGFRPTPNGTQVRIGLPQGPSADNVRARLANLCAALHVPKITITSVHGHVVKLELVVRNALVETYKFPGPEPSPVPLKNLRVGMREDGIFHRLQIWNNHLFLAGLTGSGKSGVLWSIIGALAPDILAGRVQLHMIDLKRGTEMAAGYRLYASWAYTVADAIKLLQKMIQILDDRATPRRESAMRTGKPLRNHEPERGDPHHVLMIDEIIALIKLVGDRKGTFNVPQLDGTWKEENIRVDKYVGILLLELLSQARSFGITVIVSTQNAAKDIFDLLRDMFPTMIGLRQASEQQVQMVYGTGARERGIEATAITVDEAGTAFIDSPEAGGSAIRVRFFRVTDEDIMHLVEIFGRPADAMPMPAPVDAEPSEAANVVTLHPAPEQQPADDDGLSEEDRALIAQVKASGGKVARCRYCGREIAPLSGGGRPAQFCRPDTGRNCRQNYHRTKKRMQG